MARKPRKPRATQEYRFHIGAYEPETMPLKRLAEYLADLAEVLGEPSSVHLMRVEKGTTTSVIRIDAEAEPKIETRIREVETAEAPSNVMSAVARMNHRLKMDNAGGTLFSPGGDNLLIFPGCEQRELDYGPITQSGTIDGVPILVGGTRDEVSVHLESRDGEKHHCSADRSKAIEIAPYMFRKIIRVIGVAKWLRHSEGEWEMRSFKISGFRLLADLSDVSLKKSIEELRSIPAAWKQMDDPIGELARIRHGDD